MTADRRNPITIALDQLEEKKFMARLERLNDGLPLQFKETRPRSPEKIVALIKMYVASTPPATDILSGVAFKSLFK